MKNIEWGKSAQTFSARRVTSSIWSAESEERCRGQAVVVTTVDDIAQRGRSLLPHPFEWKWPGNFRRTHLQRVDAAAAARPHDENRDVLVRIERRWVGERWIVDPVDGIGMGTEGMKLSLFSQRGDGLA